MSLIMVRAGTAAAPSLIDHFTTAQTLSLTYQGSTGTTVTGSNSVSGANILGGERDLAASVSSANPFNLTDQPYQANVSNHSLTISSGTDLLFTTELQWDGSADATKSVIDPIGLQTAGTGVDLTAGGQNRFIFGLPSSDVGGQFSMRVYTNATSCSESVWNFPGAVNIYNQTVVERLYSSFTTCSGFASAATFSNVGAISLTIATSITSPSLDMSMDLVGQDVAPYKDFGDLPDDGGTAFRYEYFKDVTLSNAFHVDTSLTLGASVSLENVKRTDGTDNATADTLDNGVTPIAPWSAGAAPANGGKVSVEVAGCPTSSCYLTAFIDWNQDGSFWDVPGDNWQTGEKILNNVVVSNGTQTVTFDIPSIAGITDGSFANKVFYTRYRLTDTPMTQGTAYGAAFSGEVEDYRITFGVTAVTLERLNASSPAAPVQPILPIAALVLAAGAGLAGFVLRRK